MRIVVAGLAVISSAMVPLLGCAASSGSGKTSVQIDDLMSEVEGILEQGTFDGLGEVRCGDRLERSFEPDHRVRFWYFDGQADQELSFRLRSLDPTTDPVLGVYSESRGWLGLNDDCDPFRLDSCVDDLKLVADGRIVITATSLRRSASGRVELSLQCDSQQEPTDVCQPQGCIGEVCSAQTMDDLICSTFVPPWQPCLELAACTGTRGGCAWQVEPDGAAHACLVDHGLCVYDTDCEGRARCSLETNPRGAVAYGFCQTDASVRAEGELCNEGFPCAEGLLCTGAPVGVDTNGICRDPSLRDGQGARCTSDASCVAGLVCGGLSLAEEGSCVPGWMAATHSFEELPVAIPDGDDRGVERDMVVRGLGDTAVDVYLNLRIQHEFRGDLRVFLRDPNGGIATVWDRQGGAIAGLELENHVVEGLSSEVPANGRWTLIVVDAVSRDIGFVERAALRLVSR